MMKELPSHHLLCNLLRYEPKSGRLFWRRRPPNTFAISGYGGKFGCCNRWNAKHENKEALRSKDEGGYFVGRILGETYKAHRVIWAMHNKKRSFGQIDHINGIRTDNRIENLREVSHRENTKNAKTRHDNKTGHNGIYKNGNSWVAQIGGGKNREYIGSFKSIKEAVDARSKREAELLYHPNHGRVE